MNTALLRGGQLIGLCGMFLMLDSVAMRLLGFYAVGVFQTGTLLLAGIAAVVVACFMLLLVIAGRAQH